MIDEAINFAAVYAISLVIGVIILFLAQKPTSKGTKIILRIIGILFLIWPFLQGIWNNYIAPK